jgi:hypothetical protein
MKVIQELVSYFERRGKLTPEHLEKLMRKGFLAADAPQSMYGLCDQVGQTYYFRVQGDGAGSVWGTDVYTGDSYLPAAAVHAGAVKIGETRVVRVTVVQPLASYQGSTRNGITSHGWGMFESAYRVEAV